MAAKKSATVDVDKYVKMLVDAGMSQAEAKAGIDKLVAFTNEQMPGADVSDINTAIGITVRSKVRELKSDKFQITVVTASPRRDMNEISRMAAVKAYNNDPELALGQGLVVEVKKGTANAKEAKNGQYVLALDNREYIDKAGTMKNRGKGKPWPQRMQAEHIVLCNGQLGIAYGDVSLAIGGVYDVFGRAKEGSTSVTLYADPKPRLVKTLPEGELYDEVYAAAKDSEMAMDVAGALETEAKGYVAVKGIVVFTGTTSDGGARIVLGSDVGNGFTVRTPFGDEGQEYVDMLTRIPQGTEVIVFGRIRPGNEQYAQSLLCYGAVMNTKASAVSKALDTLKGFDF